MLYTVQCHFPLAVKVSVPCVCLSVCLSVCLVPCATKLLTFPPSSGWIVISHAGRRQNGRGSKMLCNLLEGLVRRRWGGWSFLKTRPATAKREREGLEIGSPFPTCLSFLFSLISLQVKVVPYPHPLPPPPTLMGFPVSVLLLCIRGRLIWKSFSLER